MFDAPACLRLVLFGEQRSGTTLLAGLLDAVPGVRVASGYLGGAMHTAFTELGLSLNDRLSPRVRHVLWHRVRVAERALLPELPEHSPAMLETFDQLHCHLLGLIARPGDRIVGHKIHGPIEAMHELLHVPDVRCIYLVRDVRDVLLSRAYRGEQRLDEAAVCWSKSASSARGLADHPRLFTLRFEDLVQGREDELVKLVRWLGVDAQYSRGELDSTSRPTLQNSSFGDLDSAFDQRAVQRFQKQGEHKLVRYAQWLCGDELGAWGYPIEQRFRPSTREQVHFARRKLVLQALGLPRRAKNALLAKALPSLMRDE